MIHRMLLGIIVLACVTAIAVVRLASVPEVYGKPVRPQAAGKAEQVAEQPVDEDVTTPASQRFAGQTDEVPDFRRHVVALVGQLGCNGRACHGSFQGKGDFQLSLFGYDFANDHRNLLAGDSLEGVPRANVKDPESSLVLLKPTMQEEHEGGKRMEAGSWQYNLFLKWIKSGAPSVGAKDVEFDSLAVYPREFVFGGKGETAQLRVIANWSDGSKEDVTCLCRFKTNNEQIAQIDEFGKVTSNDPGDTHVVVFYDNGVVPIPVIQPVSDHVGGRYPKVPAPTKIDELVVDKLRKLGIVPSELSTDAEFLRRASLDITGTLPTPKEVEQFLADRSPDKRSKKIDELLERPGYAAWWATQLCDITGNNDRALNNAVPARNGAASRDWYEWIRKRVADNVPYDKLAEGIILAQSRDKDESYREYTESMSKLYGREPQGDFADRDHMPHYWARQNFRTKEERAIGFAYTFMGIRIQCAQCHKHPFDQWTKQDFDQFTGFFTGIVADGRTVRPDAQKDYTAMVQELGLGGRGNQARQQMVQLLQQGKTVPFPEVYPVPAPPKQAQAQGKQRARRPAPGRFRRANQAQVLGGERLDLTRYEDIRTPLMQWLRDKDNPYFAKAFVNRVWASYFNVGIVDPPDDLSLANPPTNAALLDYLTQGFIEHNYDMKWLHREIAGSRTYQLSWRPNATNRLDERNFSRAVPRRLPAEVAVDAIQLATASDEQFEKAVADVTGRALAIPGTLGRGGQNAGSNFALTIFGRSTRESNCDCDRSMEASLLQTVYLKNDRDLTNLINRGRDGWLSQVAREIGVNLPAAAGTNQRQLANLRRQANTLDQQLERARKAGKKQEVSRLEQRLNAIRGQLGRANPAKPQPQKKSIDTKRIVEQAYLRTLSRYPDAEELARCRQEIETADNTLNGVRNVLWALLNTKEFIVNH